MAELVLLGDEAVALGAVDAGLSAAYAYPGTPSTEIVEYLVAHATRHGGPPAHWCTNEKTAYEAALGASFVGRRTLVAMKHVGLNVAADPFMNSALVSIHGGLVVAVADDPGMHSSQNEQDSRFYADFARIACFEPSTQQEAYDLTREAFDLSERFRIPVMIRLVTRLAHARSIVRTQPPRLQNAVTHPPRDASWILLPANARRQWSALLDRQDALRAYTQAHAVNRLDLRGGETLGVITAGVARNYFLENAGELGALPHHLHVGAYPLPVEALRTLASHATRILVLEDGYPLIERQLRGLLPTTTQILGRESGDVVREGELTPDNVRAALGLPDRQGLAVVGVVPPPRPPQLCQGCPHGDSYRAIKDALRTIGDAIVTSDIGCYTLGALPPYSQIESCVCMGASIGMAKGASDAGFRPAVAVIGDSTFLHSGLSALMDAASANTDMTVLILDNETVGMAGGQPTILPSSRLQALVLGLGIDPDHVHVLDAHPRHAPTNADTLRREIEHRGLSVVIMVRECIETAKVHKAAARAVVGAGS